MKKTVSLFLALLMLLPCLAIPINATEGDAAETVEDFVITPQNKNGTTVSGGTVDTVTEIESNGTKIFKVTTNETKTTNAHDKVAQLHVSGLNLDLTKYNYLRYEYYVVSLGGAQKDGNYKYFDPYTSIKVNGTDYTGNQANTNKTILGSIMFKQWNGIEIPLTMKDGDNGASGTVTDAKIYLMGNVSSQWNAGAEIHVKSITFSAKEDSRYTAPDYSITPNNLSALGGSLYAGPKTERSNTYYAGCDKLNTTASYKGMDVFEFSTDSQIATGSTYCGWIDMNLNAINVETYRYLKVNCYIDTSGITGTGLVQTKKPSVCYAKGKNTGGWINKDSKPWTSNQTMADFTDKWNTMVIKVSQYYLDSVDKVASFVELELLGYSSIAACDGIKVYIQSITFSANADAADESFKTVGAQNRTDSENTDIRFVSVLKNGVNLADYSTVGMKIMTTYNGQNGLWDKNSSTVYRSLIGANDTYTPESLLEGGAYFSALTITGVPSNATLEFIIVPYLVDIYGNVIYGLPAEITVVNGQIQ